MFTPGITPLLQDAGSTQQVCGRVTKMYATFGYIENEIYFQRKTVIGPMVDVGDDVAVDAVYQPHMPMKWSAIKVWKVDDSGKMQKSSHGDSPAIRSDLSVTSDRKSVDKSGRYSDSKRADVEKSYRSRSPELKHKTTSSNSRDDHGKSTIHNAPRISRMTKYSLSTVDLRSIDLEDRLKSVLPPVDLYRVVSHAQDSFPLLKPLQSLESTAFQVAQHECAPIVELPTKPEGKEGFFVNLLLFSLPAYTELQQKVTSHSVKFPERLFRMLCHVGSKYSLVPIGGAWNSDLDGPDPAHHIETQIKTAIRVCKELIGLDLSPCKTWHRFLEFRYSRTEGSTARPACILFPGSDLWGNDSIPASSTTTDSTSGSSAQSVKPYHRTVVYLIPDVSPLMPSSNDWPDVKRRVETVLSSVKPEAKTSIIFPPQSAQVDSPLPPAVELMTENKSEKPVACQVDESGTAAQSPTNDASASNEKSIIAEKTIDSVVTPTTPVVIKPEKVTSTPSPVDVEMMSEQEMSTSTPAQLQTDEKLADKSDLPAKKSHEELKLASMKVSELREQLKARELPTDGIKMQLANRLKSALEGEAEEARKAEEEAKKLLESAAKAAEAAADKSSAADKQAAVPATDKSSTEAKQSDTTKKQASEAGTTGVVDPSPKVALRNYPSIVVQRHSSSAGLNLQSLDLDYFLKVTYRCSNTDTYELAFCAQTLLDLIRRDAIFTLFRSLVSAGDRNVKATQPETETSLVKRNTIDMPLLLACTLLDMCGKKYFSSNEVENMLQTLGLPMSRYQLRSLVSKVASNRRIFYRTLTDVVVPADSTDHVGSKSLFSEIDDDEYLLELVRGGDAVLDEAVIGKDPIASGSVLVLHRDPASSDIDLTAANADDDNTGSVSELANQIKLVEAEKAKLHSKLADRNAEIASLLKTTAQLTELKTKLADAQADTESYRRRLRRERENSVSVSRNLESQAAILDACRSAVRHASEKLQQQQQSSDHHQSSSSSARKRPRDTEDDAESVKSSKRTKSKEPESSEPKKSSKENKVDASGDAADKVSSNGTPIETVISN